MNLNKANLAVSKIASKDATREALHGVRIERGFTAATDGFRLAMVTFPRQIPLDELPTEIKTDAAGRLKPCTVSVDNVSFTKTKKKDLNFIRQLGEQVFVDVQTSNQNGSVVFETLNSDISVNTCQGKKNEYSFPEIDNVCPSEKVHTHKHVVNIDLLIGLLQVAKEINPCVEIAIPENYGPIEFYSYDDYDPNWSSCSKNHNTQEFYGLLMPIRK